MKNKPGLLAAEKDLAARLRGGGVLILNDLRKVLETHECKDGLNTVRNRLSEGGLLDIKVLSTLYRGTNIYYSNERKLRKTIDLQIEFTRGRIDKEVKKRGIENGMRGKMFGGGVRGPER